MTVENLTRPGEVPIEGDIIRITYNNGNVEEKQYHEIPPERLLAYAKKRAIKTVWATSQDKIKDAVASLATHLAGYAIDPDEFEDAKELIETAIDQLRTKLALGETLTAGEQTAAANLRDLQGYRSTVKRKAAQAKDAINGMTDIATIEALDIPNHPAWPTPPTWS